MNRLIKHLNCYILGNDLKQHFLKIIFTLLVLLVFNNTAGSHDFIIDRNTRNSDLIITHSVIIDDTLQIYTDSSHIINKNKFSSFQISHPVRLGITDAKCDDTNNNVKQICSSDLFNIAQINPPTAPPTACPCPRTNDITPPTACPCPTVSPTPFPTTPIPTLPPFPEPNPNIEPGDANGDGVINGLDITVTVNTVLEINITAMGNADCNEDGTVNGLDITCVVNKVLEI